MRLSKTFWQTYKEVPKDAEIASHKLLLRAGFITKSAPGIYQYLPFAVRVLHKISNIVREEMTKADAQEVTMSIVTPGELWKESQRWDEMGALMLQFKDRSDKDMCISPTNEETITDIFRKTINSYKQLPFNLFQINTKFRDEIRPRFGLMRGREFIMKDGYSFHESKECLDDGYEKMYNAYKAVFERMNLEYIIVEADAGAMGTDESKTHEFQVVADSGEDLVVYSKDGEYAANIEKSKTYRKNLNFSEIEDLNLIETTGYSTIKDVCDHLDIEQEKSLKSLVYSYVKDKEQKFVLVMLLGDDELNELKLSNYLKGDHLKMAKDSQLEKLELVKGYIGPYDLKNSFDVLFDEAISEDHSFVIGANKENYHYKGFNLKRDFTGFKKLDLRLTKVGDQTKNGQDVFLKRGIEVGHIFQLGDKYTKALSATVLDKSGKKMNPLMGCYGIGVSRIMAAAIEQNHDEKGIIWPKAIAPFQVYFAMIGKSQESKDLVNEIYNDLLKSGIEVLLDDRGMGPGFMFKDADLLGLPLRLTFGERDYKEKKTLELSIRKNGTKYEVTKENVVEKILKTLDGKN